MGMWLWDVVVPLITQQHSYSVTVRHRALLEFLGRTSQLASQGWGRGLQKAASHPAAARCSSFSWQGGALRFLFNHDSNFITM